MDFSEKKIGILGLGEENIALIKYLFANGANNLTVCDKKSEGELDKYLSQIGNGLKYQLGDNYLENLSDFEIVFRTPGIPFLSPEIQSAQQEGVIISSQTKLFFDLCPCPIISVTGTKGKGTTATLISEILKKSEAQNPKSEKKIYLGGNIGNAPIEFLNDLKSNDLVILELSSFQLQDLEKSPRIGVVLNVASEHLDIHETTAEYIEAKTSIVSHQTKDDFAVINADYLTSFEFAAQTPAQVYWFSRHKSVDQGAWVGDGRIFYRENDKDMEITKTSELKLRGEHNWENICGSITAARLAGADFVSISETIKSFKGLEHRLELVAEINGVKFYDDSFSTAPEPAIAAIKSFTEPIILIAGGSEKNADYAELGEIIDHSNVKTVIIMGVTTGPRIKAEIKSPNIKVIDTAKNFDEVFGVIKQEMKLGDVVLLSPASASFDWFKNYKDRGLQFKEKVLEIE